MARTGGVGREEPEEQLCWDKQAGPGPVGPVQAVVRIGGFLRPRTVLSVPL